MASNGKLMKQNGNKSNFFPCQGGKESSWSEVRDDCRKKGIDFVYDILFPKKCVGCGKLGRNLCYQCIESIVFLKNYSICNDYDSIELDGLIAMAKYDGLMKKIVELVKYNYIIELLFDIEPLLVNYLSKINWDSEYILAPVPLHRQRFLKRGFNQAELIAQLISRQFGNTVASELIIRKVNNRSQVGLKSNQRQVNVSGIFMVKNVNILKNKKIVLVDDVFTTGATMGESAKALKEIGFNEVYGLVLARG